MAIIWLDSHSSFKKSHYQIITCKHILSENKQCNHYNFDSLPLFITTAIEKYKNSLVSYYLWRKHVVHETRRKTFQKKMLEVNGFFFYARLQMKAKRPEYHSRDNNNKHKTTTCTQTYRESGSRKKRN